MTARIQELQQSNDAQGLIDLIRNELTGKREAAEALFGLSDTSAVVSPLLAFFRDRASLVARWEGEWRKFQSGRGIAFADREFRDMAEADMVTIELTAIRFFRRIGETEGLRVIASNTTDADVRQDAQ